MGDRVNGVVSELSPEVLSQINMNPNQFASVGADPAIIGLFGKPVSGVVQKIH
jgi:hypothetical protein